VQSQYGGIPKRGPLLNEYYNTKIRQISLGTYEIIICIELLLIFIIQ